MSLLVTAGSIDPWNDFQERSEYLTFFSKMKRSAYNFVSLPNSRRKLLVSVIIPFWGSEIDLRRALGVLAAQSFRKFEVIIVADSIDIEFETVSDIQNSGILVKKIRNSSRRGPLYSRMKGSLAAKGKYIWFMDHDDLVPPDFLKAMVSQAEENDVDIVECPVVLSDHTGQRPYYRFRTEELFSGAEILEGYLAGKSYNSLCTKLILKSLWLQVVDQISWKESIGIVFAEDLLCTMLLYSRAKTYKSLLDTHYCYVQRDDSTMNTKESDRIESSIKSLEWVLEEISPIIRPYIGRDELNKFLDREVKWSLDYLGSKCGAEINETSGNKLELIRIRYLNLPS